MERKRIVSIEVAARVSNLAINNESKNIIKIYQEEVIEDAIEDESGIVTVFNSTESPHVPNPYIHLFPRSFSSSHLTELLCDEHVTFPPLIDEDVPCCGYIGKHISRQVKHSLANDVSLREPVFVSVNVKYVLENRVTVSPVVPRGASAQVLQRLSEEQSVEPTCSICIENLSGKVVRMPRCLHMFHQDCLFEWLGRHNSCPLCRRVPYEEETQTFWLRRL